MSTDSKTFVRGVFRTLFAEHPEHWGNGLSFHNFSPMNGESVYLVRTKEASVPIGFVGWQNRCESGKRIGYYSVGLLPEYRGKGYAKEAVSKLIAEKSAGVDEVRALIHQSNTSSLRLAAALGVPVTKTAMVSALVRSPMVQRVARGALGAATGTGATYGIDQLTGADKTMNPEALRSQMLTTGVLGAMVGQPGAYAAIRRFVNPVRSIGGTNTITNLLRPAQRIAPTIGRELSPTRALSLAAVPAAAVGVPMIVGNAAKPLHQVFDDFTKQYGKEIETTGKDPGAFDFLSRKLMTPVAEKLRPALTQIGDKAINAGKSIANQGLQEGLAAGKPLLGDFAREMAKPVAGSLIGSGLGYAAGNLFQRDDPKLTPEERMNRRERQNRIRLLLSLVGGAAGSFAPVAIQSLSKKS
jgi:GNAT superfamily N-acetyltransferase